MGLVVFQPNMSEEECKEVVKNAVALATYRDGSSGGVIRLAVIDKDGTRRTVSPNLFFGQF